MKKLIATLLLLAPITANAEQDMSYHFGYALQAAMSCPALQMRMDTERKVSADYGSDVRSGPEYMEGLGAVIDDGQEACDKAQQRYACNGSSVKGLLQTPGSQCSYQ